MAPSEWCRTVGPVVRATARSGSRGRASRVDALAIVSWNVHVGGGDIAGLVRALRGGRFTGGRAVTDFVLLLQEYIVVVTTCPLRSSQARPYLRDSPGPTWGPRVDIVQVASALGLSLFYPPSMRNGRL